VEFSPPTLLCLQPKRGDLDMNQHVNNVKYVGWVMEVSFS
jgi:acyl-ACP thioesterase